MVEGYARVSLSRVRGGAVTEPLDLSSCVHPLNSSTTSSGSTLVRSHASLHCGLAGAPCPFARASASFFDLALLFLEKNGIPVKQFLSSANVACTVVDHANAAVLRRGFATRAAVEQDRPHLRKKMCWRPLNWPGGTGSYRGLFMDALPKPLGIRSNTRRSQGCRDELMAMKESDGEVG